LKWTMEFNFMLKVYITPVKEFFNLRYRSLVLKVNHKWGFHFIRIILCLAFDM
jgi:hypothetical protein